MDTIHSFLLGLQAYFNLSKYEHIWKLGVILKTDNAII